MSILGELKEWTVTVDGPNIWLDNPNGESIVRHYQSDNESEDEFNDLANNLREMAKQLNAIPALESERDALKERVRELEGAVTEIDDFLRQIDGNDNISTSYYRGLISAALKEKE